MKLTKHAIKRLRQRGFCTGDEYIFYYFGTSFRQHGDVVEYRITEKDRRGIMQRLDKLCKKAILLDSNGDVVITAYNICK